MDAEPSKSLVEQRVELKRLLDSLTDKRDGLYTPGITVVSGRPEAANEQLDLQIEELQAAIAQIDETLKGCS